MYIYKGRAPATYLCCTRNIPLLYVVTYFVLDVLPRISNIRLIGTSIGADGIYKKIEDDICHYFAFKHLTDTPVISMGIGFDRCGVSQYYIINVTNIKAPVACKNSDLVKEEYFL